ncbi:MAG: hypothetical protein WA461_04535, partial [Nitrososphaeraceae archaeon]
YPSPLLMSISSIRLSMERQSVVVTIGLFFASNRRVDVQDDKKAFRFVVTTSSAEAKICRAVPKIMNTAAIITITF